MRYNKDVVKGALILALEKRGMTLEGFETSLYLQKRAGGEAANVLDAGMSVLFPSGIRDAFSGMATKAPSLFWDVAKWLAIASATGGLLVGAPAIYSAYKGVDKSMQKVEELENIKRQIQLAKQNLTAKPKTPVDITPSNDFIPE